MLTASDPSRIAMENAESARLFLIGVLLHRAETEENAGHLVDAAGWFEAARRQTHEHGGWA